MPPEFDYPARLGEQQVPQHSHLLAEAYNWQPKSHGVVDTVIDLAREHPVAAGLAGAALAASAFGLVKLAFFDDVPLAGAALREAEPVAHLTGVDAAEGIAATERIGGRYGIFAVRAGQIPTSQFGKSLVTLVPRDLSQEVSIGGEAASAFRSPLPVGPFSLARRLAGVKSTPLGSIDLAADRFIPGEIFSKGAFRPATGAEIFRYKAHQFLLDYFVDSELYATGAVAALDLGEGKEALSINRENRLRIKQLDEQWKQIQARNQNRRQPLPKP